MDHISVEYAIEVVHKDGTVDLHPRRHNYTTEAGLDRLDYTSLLENFDYIHIGSGSKVGTWELECILAPGKYKKSDSETVLFIVGDSINAIRVAVNKETGQFSFNVTDADWPSLLPKKIVAPGYGVSDIVKIATTTINNDEYIAIVCRPINGAGVLERYPTPGGMYPINTGYCELFWEEVDYIEVPEGSMQTTMGENSDNNASFKCTFDITNTMLLNELGWSNSIEITDWNPLFGRAIIDNPLTTADKQHVGIELIPGDKLNITVSVTARDIYNVGNYKSRQISQGTVALLQNNMRIELNSDQESAVHTQLIGIHGIDPIYPKILYKIDDSDMEVAPTRAIKIINKETIVECLEQADVDASDPRIQEVYIGVSGSGMDAALYLYMYSKATGVLTLTPPDEVSIGELMFMDASYGWERKMFEIPTGQATKDTPYTARSVYNGDAHIPKLYRDIAEHYWDPETAIQITGTDVFYNSSVTHAWIATHRTSANDPNAIKVSLTKTNPNIFEYVDINKDPDYTNGGYPYFFENYDDSNDIHLCSINVKQHSVNWLLSVDTGYTQTEFISDIYIPALTSYPYVEYKKSMNSVSQNILMNPIIYTLDSADLDIVSRLLSNDLVYIVGDNSENPTNGNSKKLFDECIKVMKGSVPYDHGDPDKYILGIKPLLDSENRQMMIRDDSGTTHPLYATRSNEDRQRRYAIDSTLGRTPHIYKQYKVFYNKSIPIYDDVEQIDGSLKRTYIGRMAIIDVTSLDGANETLPYKASLKYRRSYDGKYWLLVFLPAYSESIASVDQDTQVLKQKMCMCETIDTKFRNAMKLVDETTGYCEYTYDTDNTYSNMDVTIVDGSSKNYPLNGMVFDINIGKYSDTSERPFWKRTFSEDASQVGMKCLGLLYRTRYPLLNINVDSVVFYPEGALPGQSNGTYGFYLRIYSSREVSTLNSGIDTGITKYEYPLQILINNNDELTLSSAIFGTRSSSYPGPNIDGAIENTEEYKDKLASLKALAVLDNNTEVYPVYKHTEPKYESIGYLCREIPIDNINCDTYHAVVYANVDDKPNVFFYNDTMTEKIPGTDLTIRFKTGLNTEFLLNRLGSVTLPDTLGGTIKTTTFALMYGYVGAFAITTFAFTVNEKEDGSKEYKSAVIGNIPFTGFNHYIYPQTTYWYGSGIAVLELMSDCSRWHLYGLRNGAYVEPEYLTSVEITGDSSDTQNAIVAIEKDSITTIERAGTDDNECMLVEYGIDDAFTGQHIITPLHDFARSISSDTKSCIYSRNQLKTMVCIGNGMYLSITDDEKLAVHEARCAEITGSDTGMNIGISQIHGKILDTLTTYLSSDIAINQAIEVISGYYNATDTTGYGVCAFDGISLVAFSSMETEYTGIKYTKFDINEYDDIQPTVVTFDIDTYGVIECISCIRDICVVISLKGGDRYATEYPVNTVSINGRQYKDLGQTPVTTKLNEYMPYTYTCLVRNRDFDTLVCYGWLTPMDSYHSIFSFMWDGETYSNGNYQSSASRAFTGLRVSDSIAPMQQVTPDTAMLLSVCGIDTNDTAIKALPYYVKTMWDGTTLDFDDYTFTDKTALQLSTAASNLTLRDGFVQAIEDDRIVAFGCVSQNGHVNPVEVPFAYYNKYNGYHTAVSDVHEATDQWFDATITRDVTVRNADGSTSMQTVRAVVAIDNYSVRFYTYLGNNRGTVFTFNTKRSVSPVKIGMERTIGYDGSNECNLDTFYNLYRLFGIDMARAMDLKDIHDDNILGVNVPLVISDEVCGILENNTGDRRSRCNLSNMSISVKDKQSLIDILRIGNTESTVLIGTRPDRFDITGSIELDPNK